MKIQRIEKRQMHEIIYEQIKKGILEGDILPGQKLNQDELAQQMDVSRMPVRDALKRLTNDGLLENSIHKGFVVTAFSKETLLDVLYVRSVLESEAVLLAEGSFTQKEFDALEENYEKSFIETTRGNLVKLRELNREFHFFVYNVIPSRLLLELIEKIWDRFPNYAMYTKPETAENSLNTHRDFLLALKEKKDFALAAAIMKHHILNTQHELDNISRTECNNGRQGEC